MEGLSGTFRNATLNLLSILYSDQSWFMCMFVRTQKTSVWLTKQNALIRISSHWTYKQYKANGDTWCGTVLKYYMVLQVCSHVVQGQNHWDMHSPSANEELCWASSSRCRSCWDPYETPPSCPPWFHQGGPGHVILLHLGQCKSGHCAFALQPPPMTM